MQTDKRNDRFSAGLILNIAAMLAISAGAAAAERLTGTQVSEQGRRAISPEIAVGPNGSINVIWLDKGLTADRPPPKPRKPGEHSHRSVTDLYFTRSEDGGRTWRSPVRVNAEPGGVWGFAVSKPRVAVGESGTIHVFYPANDRSPVTGLDVIAAHYTRSTDGGRTFEKPRKINRPSPTDQQKILKEGLGASHSFGTMGLGPNGAVYAFWLDARDMIDPQDGSYVFATVSRDDGKTFSEDELVLEGEACPCCQLTTAFSGDRIYVGYRRIYDDGRDATVAVSNDGAKTFETKSRLPLAPWDIEACPLKPTALAAAGEDIYAAVYAGGESAPGVYFSRSTDGGAIFGEGLAVHPDAAYSDAPELTVAANGNIQLVWQSKAGGVRRLFASASGDRGQSFTPPRELATPTGSSAYPVTDIGPDGAVYVAWQQEGERVYVSRLPPGQAAGVN